MEESILNHKKILTVDDEPDVLAVIEEEILQSCPDAKIDKAFDFKKAAELLRSGNYDLVVLDIMGVRGFDLLEIAVKRKFRVAMLTAHALTPKALKKAHDMGAMAYLPKDKLGGLVPFLENILKDEYKTGWKRLLDELENDFDRTFFEDDWRVVAGVKYWI